MMRPQESSGTTATTAITTTTTISETDKVKIDSYFNGLLSLVSQEKWNELLERIEQAPDLLSSLPELSSLCRLGTILGAAASIESVPIDLFTCVIKVAGNDVVSHTDTGMRTPFHLALMYSDRPDICAILLEASPDLVHLRDLEGLRGIDILTQKIVMKEEHLRYLKDRATVRDHQSLRDCLECARLVTLQHVSTFLPLKEPNLPMLHACCIARSDIPVSLVERTLRRLGTLQATIQDGRGNTPLHYVCAQYGPNTGPDMIDDILPRVARLQPRAAAIQNLQNEYPLDLAIRSGRGWNSGCQLLLELHPPALLWHQATDPRQVKIILLHLVRMSQHTALFGILRAKPEILLETIE